MREITLKNGTSDYEQVDRIIQDGWEYEAPSITLYQIGTKLVMTESAGDHLEHHLLEKEEQEEAEKDSTKFLKEMAYEWSLYCESPEWEKLLWGLTKPEDYPPKNKKACILVRNYFAGHCKVSLLREENEDIRIFTPKEAEDLIEQFEDETYYCSHNETSRPDYWVVSTSLNPGW